MSMPYTEAALFQFWHYFPGFDLVRVCAVLFVEG